MIYVHLNDEKRKKWECSIGNNIIKDLYQLIAKYNSCLIEKESAYFKNAYFKSGIFYGLPKKQIRNYKTCNQSLISVIEPSLLSRQLHVQS